MKLLVIRHAWAMDKNEFRKRSSNDDLRPLTAGGGRKMKKNARGLRKIAPQLGVLVSSPLLRAIQTTQIVAQVYDQHDFEQIHELRPEEPPETLLKWLRGLRRAGRKVAEQTVTIVGHEPHLSGLIYWLMAGRKKGVTKSAKSTIELRKGGAALLEFYGARLDAGRVRLLWLLTPAQLRALAKSY